VDAGNETAPLPDASGDGSITGDTGTGDTGTSDGGPVTSLLDNPTGPMPKDLKDVGLFTAYPALTTVDARAFAFEPRYPLWSNGLEKARYAVLPKGKQIDTTMRDAWEFPVGTLMFKTFSFKDPAMAGKLRPVETRVIRRVADTGLFEDQWDFQVYQWNDAGTGATLADIKKVIPRQVTVDGETFTHNIPSIKMCWNCHIANKAPVIGFDELRLNWKPGSATTTLLDQVVAKQWLTKPPVAPLLEVTGGRTPLETSVMEYLQANCAHCHNGEMPRQPGARYPMLDLRSDKLIKSTVNVMTMSVASAAGTRIVPGDPTKSILLLAMKAIADPAANTEVKPMPAVGVDRMDKKNVDMVEQWIKALKP
jgi:cytochrome c553